LIAKSKTFYSNGKLLLTGEYVVLDGALSLALPTKLGQSLSVEEIDEPEIIWRSYDENGKVWYEDVFTVEEITSNSLKNKSEISQRLIQILNAAKKLNPEFLSFGNGYNSITKLYFPKDWGLGTSSTLINNIANWAQVDPQELLKNTFGGSGYDVACAQYDSVISYQLLNGIANVRTVNFNPKFKDCLYFVYLNKKQNSRDGILKYKENTSNLDQEISTVNNITTNIINCQNLSEFKTLINQHEQLISNILNQNTVKKLLFSDFEDSIKSLGAWGGDFVLVATENNPTGYFKSKGFETILNYSDMIKSKNGS
jgi:mevalonate kinase